MPLVAVIVDGLTILVNLSKIVALYERKDGTISITLDEGEIQCDTLFSDFCRQIGIQKPSPIATPTPGLQLPR